MKINSDERKILAYLADEEGYWCFAAIGEVVRLDRKAIRRACRSLARKGFTEFKSGLWNEYGDMAGSGYRCTQSGIDFLKTSQAA